MLCEWCSSSFQLPFSAPLAAVRAVYDMIVSKDKEFAKLEEAKADARAAAAAAADKKDAKTAPVTAPAEEDSKGDTDDVMAVKPEASSAPTDSRTALQREVTQLLSFEIGKQKFDTAALFKQFPVTFSNRNKQLLFALCSGLAPGDPHPPSGQLTVTRWIQFPLPENFPQPSIARPVCAASFSFVHRVVVRCSRSRMCVRSIFARTCSLTINQPLALWIGTLTLHTRICSLHGTRRCLLRMRCRCVCLRKWH